MGQALVLGLTGARLFSPADILVTDVRPERRRFFSGRGIRALGDNIAAARPADVLILCVKPAEVATVLSDIAPVVSRRKLVLSIAAGVPTRALETGLGASARHPVPVVRAMPNMGALVGQAATAICAGRYARPSHLRIARRILGAVGCVVSLPERLLDAVTAVSGTGPAYLFHLAELMEEAAHRLGIPAAAARQLVVQTMAGSARLLQRTGKDPRDLRRAVTSKKGTTWAAFRVLESRRFRKIFLSAVEAACRRSGEMARAAQREIADHPLSLK